MTALSPTNQLVLLALDRIRAGQRPPTIRQLTVAVNAIASAAAPELVGHIAHQPCTEAAVKSSLYRLRVSGLVMRRARSGGFSYGAAGWAITPEGRQALAEVSP